MKKYILLLALIFLVGCQDPSVQKTADSNEIEKKVGLENQIVGKWISHEKDTYGDKSMVLYIFDDGTLLTNDLKLVGEDLKFENAYISGSWQTTDNTLSLVLDSLLTIDFSDGHVEEVMAGVSLNIDMSDIVDQRLMINERVYEKYGTLLGNGSKEFDGKWDRTNIHRAHGGHIDVLEVNSNYMIFSTELYYGGNSGIGSGIAVFDSENEAEYIHIDKSIDSQEVVNIRFKLMDDNLFIESNNNSALGFGMNVYIDGEFTKGIPEYTNKKAIINTFESEDRIGFMKRFLGDESWDFLSTVIDYGQAHETDLTYSGFVTGLGQGADLLMTEDNKIYYLTYGEGPANVFYTNDEKYKHIVPNFMLGKVRAFDDMRFVYKDENQETITNDYVWVRGHYDKPSSWHDPQAIQWDDPQASEYIEIIVKGSVENLCLVEFEETLVDNKLVLSEVVHNLEQVKDQTIVVKANQPEGIPYQAIRFENNGERFYYIIQEKSLSGEADALNEHIYPIKPGTHLVFNTRDSILKLPKLAFNLSGLEDFVPNGWELIDQVTLDYNDDGIKDYIGVLQTKYLNKFKFEEDDYPRILFAIKGMDNGSYQLDFQDYNLVRNYREGGVFGDPYLPLETDGKYFETNTYGGSGWRWSERCRYEYLDERWFLTQEETNYGYSFFITHHRFNNYLSGIGRDDYNNDTFENIESRGENWEPYELSFEKKLDPMLSLHDYSEKTNEAHLGLNTLEIKNLNFNEGIEPVHHDDILASHPHQRELKFFDNKYILFNVSIASEGSYIIRYDREHENGQVILKSEASDQYPNEYDDFSIYKDKLYFSRNRVANVDYLDAQGIKQTRKVITSMGLYSSNIDGSNLKKLIEHKVELDEQGDQPYRALNFEIYADVIYYYIYQSTGNIFYKIGIEGEDYKLLGDQKKLEHK